MLERSFYILDVFAEEKYAGNQLAVVADADGLSDEQMQKIAQEMNYSETTFILSDKPQDGGFNVRIFTPKVEVPFAGHPTLGTAFVIQRQIISKPAETVKLNLKVGQIPVTFDNASDVLWMKPIEPVFGECFDAGEIGQILAIEKDDIDEKFPIQQVSTGIPFVMVPLKTLDAVKRAKVRRDKLFDWIEDKQAKVIAVKTI